MSLDLNSVLLGSENPDKLIEFYTKVLGKPEWEDKANGWAGWHTGDGANGLGIGPHSEVKGKNDTPGRIMFNFATDDVPGEFERLKGLGATVVAEPYNPGQAEDSNFKMATLADPDGNYFQISNPFK